MLRPPRRSTRTDTLLPYPTRVRSHALVFPQRAVLHAHAARVLEEHDAVAAGEVARAPLRRYTHVLPQLAGVAQPIARGLVQIAHLGIGVGEDDPGLVR